MTLIDLARDWRPRPVPSMPLTEWLTVVVGLARSRATALRRLLVGDV